MPTMTAAIRQTRFYDDGQPIYDLTLNGKFVMGASSAEKASAYLALLEGNDFAFLRLHFGRCDSPSEMIAFVLKQGWSFVPKTKMVTQMDGRTFFSGNIVEYSASFNFLILDLALVAKIRRRLPEIRYTDYRTTQQDALNERMSA